MFHLAASIALDKVLTAKLSVDGTNLREEVSTEGTVLFVDQQISGG